MHCTIVIIQSCSIYTCSFTLFDSKSTFIYVPCWKHAALVASKLATLAAHILPSRPPQSHSQIPYPADIQAHPHTLSSSPSLPCFPSPVRTQESCPASAPCSGRGLSCSPVLAVGEWGKMMNSTVHAGNLAWAGPLEKEMTSEREKKKQCSHSPSPLSSCGKPDTEPSPPVTKETNKMRECLLVKDIMHDAWIQTEAMIPWGVNEGSPV